MKKNKTYIKRSNCYTLQKIANIPYLLPVGQMIADQRRGLQLNETGSYLWELLKRPRTLDELAALCADYYGLSKKQLPEIKEDVQQFIDTLSAHGMVVFPPPHTQPDKTTESFYQCIEIAGLKCMLYGPADAFPAQFDAFVCKPAQAPHQSLELLSYTPQRHENGKILLRNDDLAVIDCKDKYILLFPSLPQISEVHLTKDASYVRFYCSPPYTENFRTDFFHAMCPVYLYLAQRHNMAALHSASVLYQGKAWLFSASSGTGKSTHANLWNKLYDAPLINGDLNLLALDNRQAVIHGTPWCGSSGCFDTRTYPLGGIILLKQSVRDYTEPLPEDKRRLFTLQRLVSPSWSKKLLARNLKLIEKLAPQILICRLYCTPNPSAAQTAKREIDCYLQKREGI